MASAFFNSCFPDACTDSMDLQLLEAKMHLSCLLHERALVDLLQLVLRQDLLLSPALPSASLIRGLHTRKLDRIRSECRSGGWSFSIEATPSRTRFLESQGI